MATFAAHTIQNLSPEQRERLEIHRAVQIANGGDTAYARRLLVEICRKNKNSELGWLWLASVTRTPSEGLACIKQVLRINPTNQQGLVWLEKMAPLLSPAPAAEPQPAPAPRRQEVASAPQEAPQAVAVDPPTPIPAGPGTTLHDPTDDSYDLVQVAANLLLRTQPAEPVVEEVEAPTVPAQTAADPETRLDLCPLCSYALEEPERCGRCNAEIWPTEPLDLLLNRTLDAGIVARAYQRLAEAPDSAENELRLALACCNLHRMREARVHLERAALLDFKRASYAIERSAAYLNRPVVLVVDDSATIRDVLMRLLSDGGYLPIPVPNAWDVLERVRTELPSAILLDVTMPLLDGYEVCRQIRAAKDIKSTPVIMVSGHGDLLDKVVGKLAGASGYVTKPFKPDQLLKLVGTHVNKGR